MRFQISSVVSQFLCYFRAKCRRGRSCLSPRFRSGLACRRHFVWWKMVGTRWESSKRPLFIRTIWKDGQHHVVLQKDQDIGPQTVRSGRSNQTSSRAGKKKTPPSAESSPFKVPSVKLLLASLRHMKNDPRTKKHKAEAREYVKSAITVNIVPRDSVRYSDLNRQVSFKDEKRAKFSTKSNSVDVHNLYEDQDSIVTPPPFSYDNYCVDQFNSTLSERVMIWLDLAIQNHKQFKNVDLKKRVVTARACPIVERSTIKPEIIKPKEERQVVNKISDVVEVQPLVTSRMECEQPGDVINEEAKLKVRSSTAKRQLHIFLPLPKKYSDSGSFLSSKTSSTMNKL